MNLKNDKQKKKIMDFFCDWYCENIYRMKNKGISNENIFNDFLIYWTILSNI